MAGDIIQQIKKRKPYEFYFISWCVHGRSMTSSLLKTIHWCLQDIYVIYKACFHKSTICADNCNYHHNADVTL